jgi:vitamin B12 transporter
MKKSTIASLIGLAFSTPTFATENINLDDVVVTASRVAQPRESAIADVSVIDSEEIQRAGQSTLVELLARQVGVEVSSNGGAGSLSSVYLRGTNANHVVVLIDGMRINSVTAGTTALENLPTGQIDRIEILRGPASALYGQDAIGGVIQIFTKKGDGLLKLNANLGYGSYNTKRADAGVSGSAGNTQFALNVSSLNTQNFSAINTTNTDYSDRDAFRNLAFSGKVSHQIEIGHEIGVQFLNSDGRVRFDNSCPLNDSITFACITQKFDSHSDNKQHSYNVFSNNQFTEFWLSKVRIGEGIDSSRTFDVTSVPGGDLYKSHHFQLNWQNDFKLPVGVLSVIYDGLYQRVNSSVIYNVKKRDNDGLATSYLLDYNAHSLQLGVRHDHNSQFGNHHTGSIGYGYKITSNWRATASYGTGFKAPSFNDLYYPFSSNPNLKPEKSRNVEAGIRYLDKTSSISANIYRNYIDDLIAYDTTISAVNNIKKAEIKGLSLSASQQVGDFNMGGSIDIQSPKDELTNKQLARRAKRHASLNASYSMGVWHFGTEVIASSARYNTIANTTSLTGYTLLNATVDYKFAKDWSVQARANNILDKKYALALDFGGESYNTPGANLFINIRYQPD